MREIEIEDVYEDFSSNKEKFDFSNYSTKSKYYDNSNKLVIRKMKDETWGVVVEEFLKPKMYSFLVDNSEHKKAKDVNKNAVGTVNHNVLLNNSSIVNEAIRTVSNLFIFFTKRLSAHKNTSQAKTN